MDPFHGISLVLSRPLLSRSRFRHREVFFSHFPLPTFPGSPRLPAFPVPGPVEPLANGAVVAQNDLEEPLHKLGIGSHAAEKIIR